MQLRKRTFKILLISLITVTQLAPKSVLQTLPIFYYSNQMQLEKLEPENVDLGNLSLYL